MARFSDLPAEIIQQILDEFQPTYNDDSCTIQLARVHVIWADMLYKGFRQKYDFLDEQFVSETWAYPTMTETTFMVTTGHTYAYNLPSKRSSRDNCMVWINDFKIQRGRLQGIKSEIIKPQEQTGTTSCDQHAHQSTSGRESLHGYEDVDRDLVALHIHILTND